MLNEKERRIEILWMQYINLSDISSLTANDRKIKKELEKRIARESSDDNLLVLYTLQDTKRYGNTGTLKIKVREYEEQVDVDKVKQTLEERTKLV